MLSVWKVCSYSSCYCIKAKASVMGVGASSSIVAVFLSHFYLTSLSLRSDMNPRDSSVFTCSWWSFRASNLFTNPAALFSNYLGLDFWSRVVFILVWVIGISVFRDRGPISVASSWVRLFLRGGSLRPLMQIYSSMPASWSISKAYLARAFSMCSLGPAFSLSSTLLSSISWSRFKKSTWWSYIGFEWITY